MLSESIEFPAKSTWIQSDSSDFKKSTNMAPAWRDFITVGSIVCESDINFSEKYSPKRIPVVSLFNRNVRNPEIEKCDLEKKQKTDVYRGAGNGEYTQKLCFPLLSRVPSRLSSIFNRSYGRQHEYINILSTIPENRKWGSEKIRKAFTDGHNGKLSIVDSGSTHMRLSCRICQLLKQLIGDQLL